MAWCQKAGWQAPNPMQDIGAPQQKQQQQPSATGTSQQSEDWSIGVQNFVASESDEDEDAEGDILDDLVQFYNTEEQFAEAIPENAANLINKALRSAINATHEKELTDKYLRPRNCDCELTRRCGSPSSAGQRK